MNTLNSLTPSTWIYQEDPYFDGKDWKESQGVCLDERVANFRSYEKGLIPLYKLKDVVDWLLPLEEEPEDDGTCDGLDFADILARYEERQCLRQGLLNEANRFDCGD